MDTTTKVIAATVALTYGSAHLYIGSDVPPKPMTMMIFSTSTASSTTFVTSVPDMMSTKDKTFEVTPPERAPHHRVV
jgi:hypothetical protein